MIEIGLHGTLLVYAITCFLGALFVIIAIKETKGQSMDEICIKNKNNVTV